MAYLQQVHNIIKAKFELRLLRALKIVLNLSVVKYYL